MFLTKFKAFYHQLMDKKALCKGNFKTKKYIVIESDDWGSYETSDKKSYEILKKIFNMDGSKYIKFDCLENKKDLEDLYSVLLKHTDTYGNHPIMTAYFTMQNVDFEKAKQGSLSFVNLEDSYKKFNRGNVLETINYGIEKKLICPQLHGRIHLNYSEWFEAIRNEKFKMLLDYKSVQCCDMFKGNKTLNEEMKNLSIQDAINELSTANNLFCETFGYKATCYVPCCYVMPFKFDEYASEIGIKSISGTTHYSFYDAVTKKRIKRKWGKTGNIINLVRCCNFEPVLKDNDIIDKTIDTIRFMFKHKKPAIIISHRINYVGSISEANKLKGLTFLDSLLSKIENEFDDFEYISSSELIDRIGKHSYGKLFKKY